MKVFNVLFLTCMAMSFQVGVHEALAHSGLGVCGERTAEAHGAWASGRETGSVGWRFCTSLRTGRSASVLDALTSGGDRPPRATDSHRQQRAGLRERLSRTNLPAPKPSPQTPGGAHTPRSLFPCPTSQGPGARQLREATDSIQVGQPQACSPPCLLACCFPGKPPSPWTTTHPGAALRPSRHRAGLPQDR